MKELRLTGRKSNILLRTMGQERSVSTHVFTELEISGLNENNLNEKMDLLLSRPSWAGL